MSHTLIAKNIFVILDFDSKLWVDIFKIKYQDWHPWNLKKLPNSSSFYKPILNSADFLKANFKILVCNPLNLNLFMDPCIMDMPIMFKPTYLNMNYSLLDLPFTEIISNNSFNLDILENFFGKNLEWDWISKIRIDFSADNVWVGVLVTSLFNCFLGLYVP